MMTQTASPVRGVASLAEMSAHFGQLTEVLAGGAGQPVFEQHLVGYTVEAIPGVEHASLTVIEDKHPRTSAQSADEAYAWDQLQYRHRQGPCLEAIATNAVKLVSDLRTEDRWPLFARAIVDEGSARSVLSYPLSVATPKRIGLNLYSTRPGAFDERSVASASMFAGYASIALLAAQRQDKVDNLTRALESNREIGIAVGIVMAQTRVTSQQAFEQLREVSQRTNRKVRDIAAEVAFTGVIPLIDEAPGPAEAR